MKAAAIFLAILVVYAPVITPLASAQTTPVCTEPQAVTSPCSGVLLPPDAAASGLRCLQIDIPRMQLKLTQGEELFTNYRMYSDSLLEIERGHTDKVQSLLDTALENKVAPSWYEHPVFWFTVGFIVAAGTTIGITYAVNDGDNN